jgi:hypothetical protein
MTIETISYAGWKHCVRLSNGRIEAIVTTEVGPRIIRFGAVDGQNLLHEVQAQQGLTGGAQWRAYGGHRLWHAPEDKPRTYAPDNGPVKAELLPDGVRLSLEPEPSTGIAKEMELSLAPERDRLTVIHRLRNANPWSVELAPWAITIMAPGGVAIMPQEPYAPHPDIHAADEVVPECPSYLPARTLALWSYTKLNDPRWIFLDRFLLTRQDPAIAAPLKYGVSNRQGWSGYVRNGEMLLKHFPWQEGAHYPDQGCNAEVFTDGEMLELETLGPLVSLPPGATTEHREAWDYCKDVLISSDGAELAAVLQPLLASTRR